MQPLEKAGNKFQLYKSTATGCFDKAKIKYVRKLTLQQKYDEHNCVFSTNNFGIFFFYHWVGPKFALKE